MPKVNFLRFRGATKHCHLMGGVGCSSVTECLPDPGEALIPSPKYHLGGGVRPFSKQKAENEYSQNDFLVSREFE